MDVPGIRAEHALPGLERRRNHGQVRLRCADKEMHIGVGGIAQAAYLCSSLGAVFILAIAGGLVKIGLLQKVQHGRGRAFAVVTFKTKHILNSLHVSMYAASWGKHCSPAQCGGCCKVPGPMQATAPTPHGGCCTNYNTVIPRLQVSLYYAIIIVLL